MEKEKEMAKKYYWLKLKDNFFNQKEVKKLRRIAGGDTYTIIYLKMQLLSIKKDGIIEFEGTEKDLAEQLSYEIDEDGDNIQTTLLFLKANNLIEEISENNFLLTKVPDCIGKEGASAERVRRHRERKALLEKEKEQKMLQCNGEVTNSNDVVIESNTEIEKEKEIEKEINNNISKDIFINKVVSEWNSIGVSPIKLIRGTRQKMLNARIKEYTEEGVLQAINNIKHSDFLKGQNKNSWVITIDWFLKPNNFIKVYEDNYNSKKKTNDLFGNEEVKRKRNYVPIDPTM